MVQHPTVGLQTIVIGCLALGLLGRGLAHFNGFDVPRGDFTSFHDTAQAFASGHLPTQHLIAPATSALMAAAYIARPKPDTFLYAGEAVSFAAAFGVLIAVFLVGRRWLGAAAPEPSEQAQSPPGDCESDPEGLSSHRWHAS